MCSPSCGGEVFGKWESDSTEVNPVFRESCHACICALCSEPSAENCAGELGRAELGREWLVQNKTFTVQDQTFTH
jgi:hypothetical protein